MSRRVILKHKKPLKVGEKWICMCGLSKKWKEDEPQPFCDGTHAKIKEEDDSKVYEYDADGNCVEV